MFFGRAYTSPSIRESSLVLFLPTGREKLSGAAYYAEATKVENVNDIILNSAAPIDNAVKLFTGRMAEKIAGISIEMTGGKPKLHMQVIADEVMRGDMPRTAKFNFDKNHVVISGIYRVGEKVFVTGNAKLAEYVGQSDALAALVDGFRTLTDKKTGGLVSNLLLVGPNEITLAFVGGRWTRLESKERGYAYHVFGVNAETGEIYAVRSLQGKKNAIVKGVFRNGSFETITLHETTDGNYFAGVSKIVTAGVNDAFLAHVTTEDGLTFPITITKAGKLTFGEPIEWKGQILAPWFQSETKGLFTGDGDELYFTPISELEQESLLAYMNAAAV